MCGFCGFINRKDKKYIKDMADAIAHRGPDDESYYKDDDIALGFRRLSIIDLKGGRQPISNEDDSLVICFNGEIYNFQDIKPDLEQKGHIFKTKTDTEVILHGYEEYGEKILDKLRGMFAFVIWDKKNKKLFGARDHFGQKPFYYCTMQNTFMFGSEIKSFLKHPDFLKEVNKKALKPYLTFQTSVLEETFFKNVYKLLPGHYFIYDEEKQTIETHKYYQITFTPKNQDFDSLVNKIDETITKSIDYHTISDVPVGSYLSGGIDSSYVVSYLKPNETFSVGFDYKDFNEVPLAKDLSDLLHIQNKNELISSDHFFEISGTNYGILNLGKIHFDNYSSLKIRSLGSVGILNNKNSFLKIVSFNGCLFNLSKGIENTGKGKIKDGIKGIMMRSDSRQLSVPFSETPSRIDGKVIRNTEPIRRFDLIDIRYVSEEIRRKRPIEIKIKDFKFIPISISSNQIKNQTDSIQTIDYASEKYFNVGGKVILKPHSSIESNDFFELSMDSDLTVNGNIHITNSVIKKSSINLSGNLSNSIILNAILSLDKDTDGLIMNGEKVYGEIWAYSYFWSTFQNNELYCYW